ncbi:uncharacterized protein [Pyxicephalus adspersus]|uniref:uncharacterized protein isoform X2 n=1 Tax=Pyxicephalus adspersus TaxID=30357 RepID=UPI003B5ABFC1
MDFSTQHCNFVIIDQDMIHYAHVILQCSLSGDISTLNVEHRTGDTFPVLHNDNERKRNVKHEPLFGKSVLQTNMERKKAKPKIDPALNRYLIENQHFAWDIVESLVFEILRDEILPDVVIEALMNNPSKIESMPTKKHYDTQPSKSRISEKLFTSFSQMFLDESLNEIMKELSNHVLKTELEDFVGDHLVKTTIHDFLDELLTSITQTELSSLVEELNEEIECDIWLSNLIQSVVDMEVKDIVNTVLTESDNQFSVLLKNQIMATANKHVVDMFILDDLLRIIGTNGPLMFEKDSSGFLLDSIILEVLLKEFVTIQQSQQTTFENYPAKSFHQNMINQVTLDVILTELNMLLVEDMEDIFEYEQDIEFG